MKPKLAGFFVEHGYTPLSEYESVVALVAATAQEDEENILAYLSQAVALFIIPGVAGDVLSPGDVSDAEHIVTDGGWAWPVYYAYYVRRYHVRVPEAFVSHMRSHHWKPPQLDLAALIRITEALQPEDRWP
jgi:hypothetical protein